MEVEGLSKPSGPQAIWSDVMLALPPGEVSVMLGPCGTGKSVFLNSLLGLFHPEQHQISGGGDDACRWKRSAVRLRKDQVMHNLSPRPRSTQENVLARVSEKDCDHYGLAPDGAAELPVVPREMERWYEHVPGVYR